MIWAPVLWHTCLVHVRMDLLSPLRDCSAPFVCYLFFVYALFFKCIVLTGRFPRSFRDESRVCYPLASWWMGAIQFQHISRFTFTNMARSSANFFLLPDFPVLRPRSSEKCCHFSIGSELNRFACFIRISFIVYVNLIAPRLVRGNARGFLFV